MACRLIEPSSGRLIAGYPPIFDHCRGTHSLHRRIDLPRPFGRIRTAVRRNYDRRPGIEHPVECQKTCLRCMAFPLLTRRELCVALAVMRLRVLSASEPCPIVNILGIRRLQVLSSRYCRGFDLLQHGAALMFVRAEWRQQSSRSAACLQFYQTQFYDD